MASIGDLSLKNIGKSVVNSVSDVLASSDFISRTIGMNNSYGDIMFIVQALGREPVSLLGKNYAFIYDHVRRNYMQGMDIYSNNFEYCNKFTFYKEVPTVRFANPNEDTMNLLDRWKPNFNTETTAVYGNGGGTSIHYSESNDGYTNNKKIDYSGGLESGNPGTFTKGIESYGPDIKTCDMIGKTNSNFNHGKYETLVARFHTNSDESKIADPTQSANTKRYGQSHGRNLLKIDENDKPNGYDNPYCRVWTYHHQYNQIKRQIRPFDEANSQEILESLEQIDDNSIGFRTIPTKNYGFEGGSKRLDRYGVLNYQNGTVNIAPTAKIKDYFEGRENDYEKNVISTKKCMFSIENLAWKDDEVRKDEFDAYGLSPEQKGPLGGRIMWFPPYNIKFSEDVSVDWNSNKFIGRGENVYTYTNTERRGNLSFTLLIDHPSILDYWAGHERNGMENQGVPLKEGNSGGVDERFNQEQTLLRFFAGCEVLSAKPQEYRIRDVKPDVVPELIKALEPTPPPPDVHKKIKKEICAILYYPNNYSGKDDKNGVVNPVWYLMNGIGTQKYVNETTKNAEDIPTQIAYKANVSKGSDYGGYELGIHGISIVTDPLNQTYEVAKSTFSDLESKERKAQYLTDADGTKINGYYDDGESHLASTTHLAKIIGSKAMSLGTAKVAKNLTGATHQWYHRRYYYRVDNAYENQRFSRPTSYIDGASYQLNHSGYDHVRDNSDVVTAFGIKEDNDEYRLVSFTDIFVALEGDTNNVIKANSKDNVELIRDVLTNKEKYSNIKVSFNGHASKQGYKATNNDLAKNRALTLRNWLKEFSLLNGVEMGEPKILNQSETPKIDTGQQDEKLVKIWRSAALVIEYEEDVIEDAATAETVKVKTDADGDAIKDADGNTVPTVEKVNGKTKNTSKNYYLSAYDWLYNSPEGKNVLKAHPQLASYSNSLRMSDISKLTGKDYFNKNSWDYDDSYLQRGIDIKSSTVKRYDNEGEFFQALSTKDSFLHNLITDKIKYFDPAYHSVSPEGFNARLTFLHQCTRQGSTVGNADGSVATTAYNLAFGRPPVCVLRVGDFYYTKIIITSMSITYDSPQWDMNPEGIGMMPMFADISLNFVFLGGSDLGGPIARLQNAVSFNYYANASVYDNRAEKVEYDPSGNGKEIKFKGFTYPNIYVGNRLNQKRIGEVDDQGGIFAEEF